MRPWATPADLRLTSPWTNHREDYNCKNGYNSTPYPPGVNRGTCVEDMMSQWFSAPIGSGGWTSSHHDEETDARVFEQWVYAGQVFLQR